MKKRTRYAAIALIFCAATALGLAGYQSLARSYNLYDPFYPLSELVISNQSGESIRIEKIRFGSLMEERAFVLPFKSGAPEVVTKYTTILFRPQYHHVEEFELEYVMLEQGTPQRATFQLDRRPRSRCKFWIIIRAAGAEQTECQPSDLDDFR